MWMCWVSLELSTRFNRKATRVWQQKDIYILRQRYAHLLLALAWEWKEYKPWHRRCEQNVRDCEVELANVNPQGACGTVWRIYFNAKTPIPCQYQHPSDALLPFLDAIALLSVHNWADDFWPYLWKPQHLSLSPSHHHTHYTTSSHESYT